MFKQFFAEAFFQFFPGSKKLVRYVMGKTGEWGVGEGGLTEVEPLGIKNGHRS